jgi:hypothetical protein
MRPSRTPSRPAISRARPSFDTDGPARCSTGRPADSATASDAARTSWLSVWE